MQISPENKVFYHPPEKTDARFDFKFTDFLAVSTLPAAFILNYSHGLFLAELGLFLGWTAIRINRVVTGKNL